MSSPGDRSPLRVLLVGNYLPDAQRSMLRFVQIMERELTKLGCAVKIARPEPVVGKGSVGSKSVSKWLGYVDKYILFPFKLLREASWADVVHICDHSNAIYAHYLRHKPHVVTCHDMLAVRGGLGEETDCPATATGKILQRWILSGLRSARMMACISSATAGDLKRLINEPESKRVRVILIGLDPRFHLLPLSEAENRLAAIPALDLARPYIVHVGESLKRKNRDGILRIVSRIADEWPGQLVFVGQRLTPEHMQLAESLNLKSRIIEVPGASDDLLEALYSRAYALLFPSRFEGFGWPVVEAQACGCPAVCSNHPPLDEVADGSALTHAVDDEAGFAASLMLLADPVERRKWVELGLENTRRFDAAGMVRQYLALYQEVLKQ